MIVQFGPPSGSATTSQAIRSSRRPFQDVLDAVRGAVEVEGMKVLQEIDPQAALQGFNLEIGGARLVFFFHPLLLQRLLETDWTAIAEAPLKLALLEQPDGTVSLRMADPAAAFDRYGNPALATFGQELAAACGRILDAGV